MLKKPTITMEKITPAYLIQRGFTHKTHPSLAGGIFQKYYNGCLYSYNVFNGFMLKITDTSTEQVMIEDCQECIEFIGAKVFECDYKESYGIEGILKFAKICFDSNIEITSFEVETNSDSNAVVVCPSNWTERMAQDYYNRKDERTEE